MVLEMSFCPVPRQYAQATDREPTHIEHCTLLPATPDASPATEPIITLPEPAQL